MTAEADNRPDIDGAELAALRAATPGCADHIHLNSAGSSLMSQPVLDVQLDHLRLEARVGGYEAAARVADDVGQVYRSVAATIGARADQVALVENATVAWNQAFHSLRLGAGDQIITSEADYGANFVAYLQAARLNGVETVVAPSDTDGAVDVDAMSNLIDRRTKLISISHTPTNGGLINPAAEIGAVARAAGVPYLLDACQTVGQLDLDVTALGCDFLSATGRKYLRGPRGCGFLYASDAMLERVEPAMLDHHGADWTDLESYEVRADARRFENWEFNYATVLGLGRAAEEAVTVGLDRIERRVVALARHLRGGLTDAGFTVYDLGRRRCGIVTTAVEGRDPAEIKTLLAQRGIAVSLSAPSSTLVDATRRHLPTLLRLSVHYFNTVDELNRTVAELTDLTQ